MRVAYHSPLPPSTSGIADYSALLVPELSRLVDLEVISAPRRRMGTGADLCVYHVGNNPEQHGWIVEALRERPGLVVLHEYVLHHLIAGITLVRGEHEAYRRAMQRDAGVVGRLIAHGIIDGVVPPVWETHPEDFPLCGEVLDHATGVIAHSATVEDAARGRGYSGPIYRIPHPAWPRPAALADESDLRRGGGPLFGAFGHQNPTKRAPQLVAAFARVLEDVPDARLVLAGDAPDAGPIDRAIAAVEETHPGAIVRLPYVDEEHLWALIAACDACICLRHPTMGETSGIAIRALVCGRPLVVSDVGWFAELPDAVAIRVPVDGTEIDALTQALVGLATDPAQRERMTGAAQAYVADADAAATAERYRRAIVDVAGGDRVRSAVVRDVAQAAAEVGLRREDQMRMARRLAEAGL
jgi:glycosyltransferase involved in cell wall biosynthesis